MSVRVCAVYRCRHCGAVYKGREYDAGNLAVTNLGVGLYEGERVLPDMHRAAMVDIHTCDGCVPKFGVADLVRCPYGAAFGGWNAGDGVPYGED